MDNLQISEVIPDILLQNKSIKQNCNYEANFSVNFQIAIKMEASSSKRFFFSPRVNYFILFFIIIVSGRGLTL